MRLHHRIDGPAGAPLLVLGPSLGTTLDVWRPQVDALTRSLRVLRYDLPGHGDSDPAEQVTVGLLAESVLDLTDGDRFAVGGISLGGAVAATIAARWPGRVTHLVMCCSSARFGAPDPWLERATAVRDRGTSHLVEAALGRWFTPGFTGTGPFARALAAADPRSYAACCEALAAVDLTDRLAAITARALVIAGSDDPATPLDHSLVLARGIPDALLTVVPNVRHLASVERPDVVATAMLQHLAHPAAAGTRTRREVLGEEYVGRAQAGTTAFTRDFQDFITRYAWDGIWNRPGLDRRTRSCVTLTALVAGGHLEELAIHVRGAVRNGLTPDEIKEVLLQTAVYCGVPAANAAFAVAERALGQI